MSMNPELARLRGIERRLIELIERHTANGRGEYVACMDELRNVLSPGSAPMYPATLGHAATCSTCMPDGDGVHFRPGEQS